MVSYHLVFLIRVLAMCWSYRSLPYSAHHMCVHNEHMDDVSRHRYNTGNVRSVVSIRYAHASRFENLGG